MVLSDDRPPVDTLAVGVSEYDLAGLTPVDYLADQESMREIGHLRTPGPPGENWTFRTLRCSPASPSRTARTTTPRSTSQRQRIRKRILTTPTHPQAPDAAAAIRLLTALKATHAIQIDTGPLEAFAANIEAHYQALAERMDAADTDSLLDDRMYI